jgi:hypothetical protein
VYIEYVAEGTLEKVVTAVTGVTNYRIGVACEVPTPPPSPSHLPHSPAFWQPLQAFYYPPRAPLWQL